MTQPNTGRSPPELLVGGVIAWCRPSTIAKRSFLVSEADTALFLGGDFPVAGTPVLIWWTEVVSSQFIREQSQSRYGSVGVRVDVRHTGVAAIGEQVVVQVEVISVIFQMVRFAVVIIHAETEAVVLSGEHDRAIVSKPV